MRFLEQDLEEIIFKTDNIKLNERGLDISGTKIRQLRIGNYGTADIITYEKIKTPFDNYLDITIWELKKDIINTETLLQAIRYCKGVKRYLETYRCFHNFNLKIKLVGKTIDKNSDFIYLTDFFNTDDLNSDKGIKEVSFYTYEYDFDGISFNQESEYKLTDEGF